MTETVQQETTVTGTPLSEDCPPEAQALVRAGIAEVTKAKSTLTLADLFQRVTAPAKKEVSKEPPVPLKLSDEVKEAIARIPEVFGKVVVTADRRLTHAEAKAIVEERQTIDLVLSTLKKRKEESIREVLANHLDHLIPEAEAKDMRLDAKGHYAPWETQNVSVEGTGLKIQRSSSGGKPNLTIEHVEELHREGKIDRATYLAITKKPDLPRVLDEDGLHKTIQKNPALFFLLAERAEPTTPTTTIKVVKDT